MLAVLELGEELGMIMCLQQDVMIKFCHGAFLSLFEFLSLLSLSSEIREPINLNTSDEDISNETVHHWYRFTVLNLNVFETQL